MAEHPERDPEALDLSAFEVPEPPPGLADRVLARLPLAPRPARRPPWTWLAAVAAVLLLALPGAWWALREFGPPRSGERDFTRRETLAVGPSALAVAEPGTRLRWSVGRRGAVHVHQSVGRVFYRVETGSDFQVDTPAGQVSVRGTCFTLEVFPSPSARALLSVQEGRVTVTHLLHTLEVSAGESAELLTNPGPRLLPEPGSASAAGRMGVASEDARSRRPPEDGSTAELESLRERVRLLEQSLPGARRPAAALEEPDSSGGTWLNPSHETLLRMAKECHLRWDAPSLQQRPHLPDAGQWAKLGVTEAELPAVQDVHEAFVLREIKQLRALYIEVTGDENGAHVLAAQSLKLEIFDKSSDLSIRQAFQRLARERAGLERPPSDVSTRTPAERLLRFDLSLGDAYERALAEKLGPKRARQLRLNNEGWLERRDSRASCPPDGD